MNSFNFSRNPFNGANNQTKIAGDYVHKSNDGGRMSLDEVRNNMSSLRNPNKQAPQSPSVPQPTNEQLKVTRDRVQNLRNIGRK